MTTMLRLELVRLLRDPVTMFFTAVLPAFFFVAFGASQDFGAIDLGNGVKLTPAPDWQVRSEQKGAAQLANGRDIFVGIVAKLPADSNPGQTCDAYHRDIAKEYTNGRFADPKKADLGTKKLSAATCQAQVTVANGGNGSINAGVGPFTGRFIPSQFLASLRGGSINGTWQLEVSDVAALDTGTLQSLSLTIDGGVAVVGVVWVACCATCCGGGLGISNWNAIRMPIDSAMARNRRVWSIREPSLSDRVSRGAADGMSKMSGVRGAAPGRAHPRARGCSAGSAMSP